MKHIWTVICRNVLEDKNTGNLSLVDILDRISFSADLPEEGPYTIPIHQPYYVVTSWLKPDRVSASDFFTRIRFLSPDGAVLVNHEEKLEFEHSSKLRVSGQVGSLPFIVNGMYEFEVAYLDNDEWEVVARIPVEIYHEQPEPEQQKGEPTH